MLRRTPLKRTAFRRKPRVEGPTAPKEVRPLARATRRGTYSGATTGEPVDKENLVRSETYRRLVAAMPCCWCGREGLSQAAHPNHGKGMSLKTDDRRCFALCADRCHPEFDQGSRLTREQRRDMADEWGEKTRLSGITCRRGGLHVSS